MYFRTLRILLIVGFFALLIARHNAIPVRAEDQPLVAYSQGVLQADSTVLYSVLLANNQQSLSHLIISSTIPADALSAEAVIAPNGAALTTASDKNTIQWQVDKLAAGTMLGPFTYRVTFPADFKNPPASTEFTITAGEAVSSIKAVQAAGTLAPSAESADVTITPAGTADAQGNAQALPIGDTGVLIYVPDKAVAAPTTLHFTRIAFSDQAIPKAVTDTWWCALVKIESDPQVTLSKPILIGLPTRQILTPGMSVQLLTRSAASEDWQPLDTAQGTSINAIGNLAVVMITGKIPIFLAAGVSVKERQTGSLPVTTINVGNGFAGTSFSTATGGFGGKVR